MKKYTVEIKQVNLETAGITMVDRCQSCHIGASNPEAIDFPPTYCHPCPWIRRRSYDFNKMVVQFVMMETVELRISRRSWWVSWLAQSYAFQIKQLKQAILDVMLKREEVLLEQIILKTDDLCI